MPTFVTQFRVYTIVLYFQKWQRKAKLIEYRLFWSVLSTRTLESLEPLVILRQKIVRTPLAE